MERKKKKKMRNNEKAREKRWCVGESRELVELEDAGNTRLTAEPSFS